MKLWMDSQRMHMCVSFRFPFAKANDVHQSHDIHSSGRENWNHFYGTHSVINHRKGNRVLKLLHKSVDRVLIYGTKRNNRIYRVLLIVKPPNFPKKRERHARSHLLTKQNGLWNEKRNENNNNDDEPCGVDVCCSEQRRVQTATTTMNSETFFLAACL